jgi:hypothetical protein
MYAMATTGKVRLFEKIDTKAKLAFERAAFRVRQQYRLQEEDFAHLIMFAYLHNPLKVDDLGAYGKFANLEKSAGAYVTWKRHYATTISEVGVIEAIKRTIPKETEESNMDV